MALDVKMIPFMQVDFSVLSQEAKVEGTVGKFKESDSHSGRPSIESTLLSYRYE
jgi:hypothetical protein